MFDSVCKGGRKEAEEMESKRAKGKRRRRNTPSAGSSRDCCSVLLLPSLEGAAVTQAKVESVDRNVCLSIIISRSEREEGRREE